MTIDARKPSPMRGGNSVKISGPRGSDPRSTIADNPRSVPNSGKGDQNFNAPKAGRGTK